MTRAIAALVVALFVIACAGASPYPTIPATASSTPVSTTSPSMAVTPSPGTSPQSTASPVPVPSNACGGFRLKVVNVAAEDVTVTINGTYAVTVAAGSSETMVEFLPPQKPLMPWTVVVTNGTGSEIGTQFFTGPVDQKLTFSDGEITVEPYDIREDDC